MSIILPRQARDKHIGKALKKRDYAFSCRFDLSIVDEVPSGPGAPLRRVAGEDELPAPSGAAGASDEAAAAAGAAGRGKDRRAEQLEGPPGTAILYDARTWHRQHANLSDKPRTALLFVYTPRWILPMGNLTLHSCFPFVCPEPVLAKR